MDTLCGHILWTHFEDTRCGHISWTHFTATHRGHTLKTNFVDTLCGRPRHSCAKCPAKDTPVGCHEPGLKPQACSLPPPPSPLQRDNTGGLQAVPGAGRAPTSYTPVECNAHDIPVECTSTDITVECHARERHPCRVPCPIHTPVECHAYERHLCRVPCPIHICRV